MSSEQAPDSPASGLGSGGSRPRTTPDFLLSHPTVSIRSCGSLASFSDPDEAATLLRSGKVNYVVGALPFDPSSRAALTVPSSVIRTRCPLEPPAYYRSRRLPAIRVVGDSGREVHRQRVASAITELAAPSPLEKVVLARTLSLRADSAVDTPTLAAKFIDHSPRGDGFLVDLSPAGGRYVGRALIGSSPELLIRRLGRQLEAFPLAGSAPRTGDPNADAQSVHRLTHSAKDHSEHQFVVDMLRDTLAPICTTVKTPPSPVVTSTRTMFHLGSPITAELADASLTALDLARLIHPTPAVCGHPTSLAANWIDEWESDRGFYSGAVGWCDSTGDGAFVVAIRCLELDACRTALTTWAGGGVVAASTPDAEVAETDAKFRTVLGVTGAEMPEDI